MITDPFWQTVITWVVVVPLAVGGALPYAWLALLGRVRPNIVTWLIFAFVGLIGWLGQWRGGAPASVWLLSVALAAGPVTIIAATLLPDLHRGDRGWRFTRSTTRVGWTTNDLICLVLGMLGVGLYWVYRQDVIAVWIAIVVDAIACWPTIRRAWTSPQHESTIPFWTTCLSSLVTWALIPLPWTVLAAALPVFLVVAAGAIWLVIVLARRRNTSTATVAADNRAW